MDSHAVTEKKFKLEEELQFGFKKVTTVRKSGKTAGLLDVVVWEPKETECFRTKAELQTYVSEHPEFQLLDIKQAMKRPKELRQWLSCCLTETADKGVATHASIGTQCSADWSLKEVAKKAEDVLTSNQKGFLTAFGETQTSFLDQPYVECPSSPYFFTFELPICAEPWRVVIASYIYTTYPGANCRRLVVDLFTRFPTLEELGAGDAGALLLSIGWRRPLDLAEQLKTIAHSLLQRPVRIEDVPLLTADARSLFRVFSMKSIRYSDARSSNQIIQSFSKWVIENVRMHVDEGQGDALSPQGIRF